MTVRVSRSVSARCLRSWGVRLGVRGVGGWVCRRVGRPGVSAAWGRRQSRAAVAASTTTRRDHPPRAYAPGRPRSPSCAAPAARCGRPRRRPAERKPPWPVWPAWCSMRARGGGGGVGGGALGERTHARAPSICPACTSGDAPPHPHPPTHPHLLTHPQPPPHPPHRQEVLQVARLQVLAHARAPHVVVEVEGEAAGLSARRALGGGRRLGTAPRPQLVGQGKLRGGVGGWVGVCGGGGGVCVCKGKGRRTRARGK